MSVRKLSTLLGKLLIMCIAVLISPACSEQKKQKKEEKKNKQVVIQKKAKPKKKKKLQKTKQGFINNGNLEKVLAEFASKNKESIILIKTNLGNIKVKLYRDVKLHSANFLMLAKDGYFDGTVFYRVVPGLVIQGGDTDDSSKGHWKRKIGQYEIPPEIKPKYIHKKGALAMSRRYKKNPEKKSSSWDFYIVHGQALTPGELARVPEEHKETYRTLGGTPHLDGEHTVFGEVISGLNVVDKITKVKRDRGDWPINDVTIQMEVLR